MPPTEHAHRACPAGCSAVLFVFDHRISAATDPCRPPERRQPPKRIDLRADPVHPTRHRNADRWAFGDLRCCIVSTSAGIVQRRTHRMRDARRLFSFFEPAAVRERGSVDADRVDAQARHEGGPSTPGPALTRPQRSRCACGRIAPVSGPAGLPVIPGMRRTGASQLRLRIFLRRQSLFYLF